MQFVLFYVRLLSLSIKILHLCWDASILLHLSVVHSFSLLNFILLYEFNLFIDSPIDEDLRCFSFWLLRLKLREHPCTIYLFVDVGFISLEYLGVDFWVRMLWNACKPFCKVLYHFTLLLLIYESSTCSVSLWNFDVVSPFNFSHSGGYVVFCHYGQHLFLV